MTETPVDEETNADLSTVVDLIEDEHVRTILVETSVESLSATELGERCEASVHSIYRRLDQLAEAGLLDERTRLRKDGHHETVYASLFESFELTIRDGDLEWSIEHADSDVADELSRMWGQF